VQVIYNELLQYTDSGAAVGDPVAVFESSALLAPRGRFDVELYLSFMKLTGQVTSTFMHSIVYRVQSVLQGSRLKFWRASAPPPCNLFSTGFKVSFRVLD
jgi:hypothetical protein